MADLYIPVRRYVATEPGRRLPLQVSITNIRDPKDKKEVELSWGEEHGYVDGRGNFTVPALDHDETFQVTVTLVNEPVTTPETIEVEVKKAPVKKQKSFADKVEPRKHGKDGRYSVNWQVLNQEGEPHKCVLIFNDEETSLPSILPGGAHEFEIPTDDLGFYSLKLSPFTERRRKIYVEVRGSDVDGEVELEGPRLTAKKGTFRPAGGFWANLLQK